MHGTAQLGPEQRDEAWRRLQDETFDVLVIGGGVTGAGVALDAVTRGLSTVLVEARDYASGTSSRSSKLFHGGLRYLEQLNFSLVREALRERDLSLTTLAPHLVKPVSFLYPLTHRGWERGYVGAGMAIYDTLGGGRAVPRHRHLSRTKARRLFPSLKGDALIGAIRYYDAQTDDARHTLSVARTAAAYGAVLRTSTQVTSMVREGGRVVGAEVRDVETGATTTVRAGVVINCTGVWTDDVQELSGGRGRFQVRASKGVHIVVPADRINGETGMILRTETSVLFVIPWGDRWIIGTTDTDWKLSKAHPAATRADIDYILEHVNAVLSVPLTHDDILGVYAGLRPLLHGESEETSQLSREHAIGRPLPGLFAIAGGKYTTYRVMAKDAVDEASKDLGRPVAPSVTAQTPLVGADGYAAMVNQVERLGADEHVPGWRMRKLLDRYGALATEVLAPASKDASLLQPVPGAEQYLRAEILYGATHEGALHLDDLLARRTHISIDTAHRGTESARPVAELVAPVLGWDERRVEEEIETYVSRVAAERASQEQPDDAAADAVRLEFRDTRDLKLGRR